MEVKIKIKLSIDDYLDETDKTLVELEEELIEHLDNCLSDFGMYGKIKITFNNK